MSAQMKGPAEVAASPSHGSNNPQEGNAVNKQHDTTAPVSAATFDPIDYAERLYDLRMLARSADVIVGSAFESAVRRDGLTSITQYEEDLISFFLSYLRVKVEAADATFEPNSFVPLGSADSLVVQFAPARGLTVREAITRHKAAFEALGPIYEAESQSSTAATRAAVKAADAREGEAKTALMRARPASLDEEAERLEYLFSRTGPWKNFMPTLQDGMDMVASLRAE